MAPGLTDCKLNQGKYSKYILHLNYYEFLFKGVYALELLPLAAVHCCAQAINTTTLFLD